MSDSAFLQELGLPAGYDLDRVEQRFLEHMKAKIQSIAETFDEEAVKQEEEWLRRFYRMFFECAVHWATIQAQAKKEIKDHPDAAKLKMAGKQAVESLQLLIVEFASCYMHLNRFMTLLRDEIKKEEIRLVGGVQGARIRWTADAGILMDRNKKLKLKLIADIQRLKDARPVLEKTAQALAKTRSSLTDLFGKDKCETFTRGLTASLRTSDFKKAEKVLKEIAGTKKKFTLDQKSAAELQKAIDKAGRELVTMASGNAKLLEGSDHKLCLRPHEADMAHNGDVAELKKIKAFMTKYYIPYLEYKLDTIQMLRDKLLVVGSLESLMTLYKRLITGIAMPLSEVKEVRAFEGEVLNHINWLLQGHFLEIPKIMVWAREIVQEFRAGVDEYAAIETMKMDEVAVDEKNIDE